MGTKLLVKNLPSKFTEKDKYEFLQLFGSKSVICLNGKLKNSCFVQFEDESSSQQALDVLHQFELLGQRLVVEFAKPIHEKICGQEEAKKVLERKTFLCDKKYQDQQNIEKLNDESDLLLSGVAPNVGLNHNFPAHLHYKYPEPNVAILTNIANALASVPKFYTLVLHLMNKLNLPPPFTGVTPSPPLSDDSVHMQDASVDTADLQDFASSDESELESDSDNKKHEIYQHSQIDNMPIRKRKRLRAAAPKDQEKLQVNISNKSKPEVQVESAFELSSSLRRLEFRLGNSIKEAVEKKQPAVHFSVFDERGQFGKIEPVAKVAKIPKEGNYINQPENTKLSESNQVNESSSRLVLQKAERDVENEYEQEIEEKEEEIENEDENLEYITLKKLNENKMPSHEILTMNQFKNYKEGDRTNRLYIKNISKQVTTEELLFIFKRFIRNCSEEEKALLDIRHMKEGRMKGQAFVTFPNEDIAEKALRTVHGYVLQEKPMVIQFGKSGK